MLFKRSSGYTELDVVVRGYNSQNNTVDYAALLPNGEVVWMGDKDKMGVGATREAKHIFMELERAEKKQN